MEKTPSKRSLKLSCKLKSKAESSTLNESVRISELSGNSCATSTPIDVRRVTEPDNEDSPLYFPCTQEMSDEIDVLWDWNSPQTKHRQKRKQKRLIMNHSPKIPIKRHPSNNQIQNFEKVREELQALREQISIPDNEDCLLLSPLEEAEFKNFSDSFNLEENCDTKKLNCTPDEVDDLFNDSVDEQLLLCSQKVESNLRVGETTLRNTRCRNNESLKKEKSNPNNNNKTINLLKTSNNNQLADDSFDIALQTIKDDDIVLLTQTIEQNGGHTAISRIGNNFLHESQVQCNNTTQNRTGKVEFHRTQSFELARQFETLPKSKLEEIERKRKEALAKLESKRRKEVSESKATYSPMKCSPEEIEQKRLQALAKLEAKRQQDIIERKRQEALRRLQQNRMKNATVVKRL